MNRIDRLFGILLLLQARRLIGGRDIALYLLVFDDAEMTLLHLAPVALTTE